MIMRRIPSTGEPIGVLGLGSWRAYDVTGTAEEMARLGRVIDCLREYGGSVVDSSPMYGRAEQMIGRILEGRNNRAGVFLATKVWTRGGHRGIRQMENSFDLLKTGQIDLMQVHNLVDASLHLPVMRRWRDEGRFRYLGYTHYVPGAFDDLMQTLRRNPVDFLQFCYSIDLRDAEKTLLPFCRDNGVGTLINRPFGGGALLAGLASRPLPDLARELSCDSWAQFCLKYVISHPAVTCVIPGTGNPDHMRALAVAADEPIPDATTRKRMADLF